MADSKLSTDTNFNNFLEDIVTKRLNFSQSDHEVHGLQQLVHEMVNNIVKEAFPPDSGFTVIEIIPVGSMAEDTRIIGPNEFDFMIVLDEIHADDITAMLSCAGGVYFDVKSECRRENCLFALNKSSTRIVYMRNGPTPNCDCRRAMLDKAVTFSGFLDQAIRKMVNDDCFCSVPSFPGKLRIEKWATSEHGPALRTCLVWETYSDKEKLKTMRMWVDLVLAIELEINDFFLEGLDVFHQQYYNKLKATKKVHVTEHSKLSNNISTLQVSFAFNEVQLLRDENETHKKCYKLLKYAYISNGYFTSFVLKNLVLQHAVCCEGGELGWCFLKILGDLRDKFSDLGSERPIIPHIFCTKRNTVKLYKGYQEYKDYWIDHRKALSDFIEILEKIKDGMPTPSLFRFWIPNYCSAFTRFATSEMKQTHERSSPSKTDIS